MASTKNKRNYRPPFDPDRNFVAARSLPVNGKKFGPGDPFDKSAVTSRRLFQLYEQRAIKFAGDGKTKTKSAKPVIAIGPTDRSLNAVPGKTPSLPRIRRKKSDATAAAG